MEKKNTHKHRWKMSFDKFCVALDRLRIVLEDKKLDKYSELEIEGITQRFENTFEHVWKTLHLYLKIRGISITSINPGKVFEKCAEVHIFDEVEIDLDTFMDMKFVRNTIAHVYTPKTFKKYAVRIKEDFLPELEKAYSYFMSKESNEDNVRPAVSQVNNRHDTEENQTTAAHRRLNKKECEMMKNEPQEINGVHDRNCSTAIRLPTRFNRFGIITNGFIAIAIMAVSCKVGWEWSNWDYNNALPYIRVMAYDDDYKKAEQDYVHAQYMLGACHFNGIGLPQNRMEAVKWFQKTAELGFVPAKFMLGRCNVFGEGTSKNEVAGIELIRAAAEQSHCEAQFLLGLCYSDGIGVPQDKTESAQWFFLAAEQGHENATILLRQIKENQPKETVQ